MPQYFRFTNQYSFRVNAFVCFFFFSFSLLLTMCSFFNGPVYLFAYNSDITIHTRVSNFIVVYFNDTRTLLPFYNVSEKPFYIELFCVSI